MIPIDLHSLFENGTQTLQTPGGRMSIINALPYQFKVLFVVFEGPNNYTNLNTSIQHPIAC
jgi:hypothetical protein